MPVLGRATLELNADSAKLEQDLGRAVTQAATLGTAIGTAIGQGVVAGIRKLEAMVSTAIETGDELNKLSQKTGMTVERLSELRVAAQLADVPIGTLKNSIAGLYEKMSQAGRVDGKAKSAFEAIGLDIEELRKQKPDELFRTVSGALAKYSDDANRAALQTAIFGGTGKELSPLINELGKTTALARELGITMDKETTEGAERFKDNMTVGRIASEAMGMRIATVLLPTLEKLSGFLVDNAKNTERLDMVTRAADTGLKLFATAGTIVGTVFGIVGQQIGNLAATIGLVVRGDFAEALRNMGRGVVDLGTKMGESVAQIELTWTDAGEKAQAGAERNGARLAAPAIEATKKIKQARKEADAEFQAFLKIRAIEEEGNAATQKFYAEEGKKKEEALAKEIADRELMNKQVYEFADAQQEAYDKGERIAAGVEGVGSKIKEANSFAHDMGLTFTSAFEKAVAGGEKLGSIVKGLGKDLLAIAFRKTVTEPLGDLFSGALKGIGTSIFGGSGPLDFLKGLLPSFDVGSSYVPRDMLAMVHQGEAIIPAAQNRAGAAASAGPVRVPDVNFHFHTPDGRTAAAMLVENKETIKNIIRGAMNQNGRSAAF